MTVSEQVVCNDCFRLLAVREERTIGLFGMRRCKCCGCFVNYQGGDGYHAIDASQLDEAKVKFEARLERELMTEFGDMPFSLREGPSEQLPALPAGVFDMSTVRAWLRERGYAAWSASFNPLSWKFTFRWNEP